MSRKILTKWFVALCVCGLLTSVFAGSALAASDTTSTATSPPAKTGACDKSLAPVEVGTIVVLESPVLSLIDQADALKQSVKVFNQKYNGIGGHCMNVTICDTGSDPNQAMDCARDFVDSDIVTTLNDTIAFGNVEVAEILSSAAFPRVDSSPNTDDLKTENVWAIGGGGVGTTFMMAPPLMRDGAKKIYGIAVDTPAIDALGALIEPIVESYDGGEWLGFSKVPAGTTDYQQFILAAEDAGADGVILPLGENEALQVLQAAQQLGTELKFSSSLGTFGKADVKAFGPFAKQIYFNAELPPVTGDQKRWPILKTAIADLASSGKKELQADQIKSSPFRSWVAVYHLKNIIENFGDPDNITRESITAAMNAATDVDTFGLIPPWTPAMEGGVLGFRITNPWYYQVTWDGKKFVVDDEQLNLTEELDGNHDYEQPSAA
jgi:ABC-type branched-subunit amino acid transport system substrate-binding protein